MPLRNVEREEVSRGKEAGDLTGAREDRLNHQRTIEAPEGGGIREHQGIALSPKPRLHLYSN